MAPPSEIQFSLPSDAPQGKMMNPPILTASFSVYLTAVGAANATVSLFQHNQTAGHNALSSADEDFVKLQPLLQQLHAEKASLKAQISSFSKEEHKHHLNIHSTLEEILYCLKATTAPCCRGINCCFLFLMFKMSAALIT